MTGHGEKQSRKAEQALAALLTEPTITAAAAAAGVAEKTLRRWLREQGFATAFRVARREVTLQAGARLQSAAGEAVGALQSVMGDTGAPPAARVSAARTILELSLRSLELEDLAERLEVLEARLAESPNTNGRGPTWTH
jgi:hypothetical protein